MRPAIKGLVLFLIGGATYALLEVIWRGYTHVTMFVLGGVLFIVLGALNENLLEWDTPLFIQGLIGAVVVTSAELISGIVLNLWLGMNVWSYSDIPFNFMGQICLPFSLLWVPVSMAAIVLDDYIRFWLFGERRPAYTLFKRRNP
jgi:uncharacterized membrane protein|nr:MAG TPA: Putative ABC-transporter type IV [Caudoviricetes sp.]